MAAESTNSHNNSLENKKICLFTSHKHYSRLALIMVQFCTTYLVHLGVIIRTSRAPLYNVIKIIMKASKSNAKITKGKTEIAPSIVIKINDLFGGKST